MTSPMPPLPVELVALASCRAECATGPVWQLGRLRPCADCLQTWRRLEAGLPPE